MTFALYLSRVFALSAGAALLALGALAELLDLLDNGNVVMARNGRLSDLAYYAALIAPSIAASVIPTASLIGALVAFSNLAGHNEIVAMRAAGMTLYWIVVRLSPAALAIGVLYFLVRFAAAPYTEIQIHQWLQEPEAQQEAVEPGAADGAPSRGAYWIGSGPLIMNFEGADATGRRLRQVTLYERGPGVRLTRYTSARAALYENGRWRFDGVTDLSINAQGAARTQGNNFTLENGPQPVDILTATIPNARARLREPGLPEAEIWAGGNSPSQRLTNFYEALAAPFVPLIMLVAASPLALGTSRQPARLRDMGVALAAGFGYLLASGVFRTLGESGVMPPLLAVWGPMLIFALATASILAHREG